VPNCFILLQPKRGAQWETGYKWVTILYIIVCGSPQELNAKVYQDFESRYDDIDYLGERLIVSTTNEIIQERNFEMVMRIGNEITMSVSRDECVEDSDKCTYDTDILNKINASGMAPHRLPLCEGASIIVLTRNLNPKKGHVNGIRLKVLSVTKNLITAIKLVGDGSDDDTILIPRIPMMSKDTDFPVPFERVQFPVLLAYYLTISRAQGQTLKVCGADLPNSIFGHGQLYVAESRVGDPDGFSLYADQNEFDGVSDLLVPGATYTRNLVYKEVYQFAND
jgi:ATP-dependent DNA helicase PIF1